MLNGNLVSNVIVPIAAAIIGALATAFFSRPKRSTLPSLVYDSGDKRARISKVSSRSIDGASARDVTVKWFEIESRSESSSESLIIEFKNLNYEQERFHVQSDPSAGLLESYYDVSFSKERESLRIKFSHFPGKAKFSVTLTIDDPWVLGEFQTSAKDATVVEKSKFIADEQALTRKQRKMLITGFAISSWIVLNLLTLIASRP